ncbi:hypothetical protein O6H91_07G035100 [Diphasiastrum complanatum]|uniref:Uncharacterized protein n=1 Tax=Diphasiastrum complanatum TaxID=34168 RepID=A0ACC2D3W7_DIPCM|nr:hypothetical protein O6H91_07G035100 [Diphasiastrum complanatum]
MKLFDFFLLIFISLTFNILANFQTIFNFLKKRVSRSFFFSLIIVLNPFNPQISFMWNADMDIEYILDPYVAASYCTSYMKKVDNTLTKASKDAMSKSISNNIDTLNCLRST